MPNELSESTKTANAALNKLRIQSKNKWNNRKYTKSIAAIVDVMGIKEWFNGKPDFQKQMKIYKAWEYIIVSAKLKEIKEDLYGKYGEFPLKYSILSDSIVVSIDIDIPNAFGKFIMYLRLIINSMFVEMNPPFMTRGAIVIGDIFQEDNIVFGPALIKAHYMESKLAVNFRHILDKKDYDTLRKYKEDFFDDILIGWFNLDDDGYYSFDYLRSYLGYVDNRLESYPDDNEDKTGVLVLNRINKKIESEIKNNKDMNVICKYEWMKRYFKQTMQWAIYRTAKDDYGWLKRAHSERKSGRRN